MYPSTWRTLALLLLASHALADDVVLASDIADNAPKKVPLSVGESNDAVVGAPHTSGFANDGGVSGPSGPSGPSGGSIEDCDPEMIGYELITGYVYTAPTDLLDSLPGTLMLTDCLEACSGNDSCQAVNYETGLCILFSSNADDFPGKCHGRRHKKVQHPTLVLERGS